MSNRKIIIRKGSDYYELYKLIKDFFGRKNINFLDYDQIDWINIGSHTVLERTNNLVIMLNFEEYNHIADGDVTSFSNERIDELRLIFWLLAKIQCDFELLKDLSGKNNE